MRPVASSSAAAAARATSSLHSVLLAANLCGVALLLLLHLRSDGGDNRAAPSNVHHALGALDSPQVMAGEGNRELLSEAAEGAEQACATSAPLNAGSKELLQWSEQQYQVNVGRRNAAVGKDPVKFVMDWFKMTEGRPYKARAAFMFEVFAPAYPCLMEERLGTWLDGGKWVCRPSLLNASSVVYSIGSDGKDSFEEEIYGRFKSQIHVFDHTLTPRKKAKVEHKKAYKFHPIGLAVSSNESASLSSFKDLTSMLGHSFVDIFKVDCESCEYEVIPSILDGYTTPPFGQLLIEIHDLDRSNADRLTRFLHKIESHGYLASLSRKTHRAFSWCTRLSSGPISSSPMALSHSSILNLIPATISSDTVAGGTPLAGSIPSGRLLPSSTISSSLRHVLTPSQAISSASHNAASSLFPSPLHSFHHVSLPRATTAGAAPAALSTHPRAMLPQISPFPQASRAASASPDQVALAASATPTSILRSDKDAQSFSNAPQLNERSAQVLSDLRKASAAVAVSTAFALSAGCCAPGAALALDQLPPPVPPSEYQVAVSTTNSAEKSGLLADDFISQLESIPPAPALATSAPSTPAALTRQVSLTSAGSSGRVVSPEAQEEAKAMLMRQLEEQDRLRNAEERMCDAVLSPVKQGIPGPDSSSSPSRSRSVTWADCAADFPADVMQRIDRGGARSVMGPVGGGAAAASAAMGGVATGGPIAATEVSFAGAAAASLTLESAAAAAIANSSGGLSAKLAAIMGQSLQHFGVGGVAGAVGAAAVYPLDTIKTRMQAQRKIKESESDSDDSGQGDANGAHFHSAAGSQALSAAASGSSTLTSPSPSATQVQYRDEWDCFIRMVREEGPAALYSGLGAQLVGIAPEKAIKLTVNEVLLALLESAVPGARLWVLEIIAGGGGGFCQVVFTNPVEIVKVRMQARKKLAAGSSSDSEAEGALASASAAAGAGAVAGASGAVVAEPQQQQQGKTSWQVVQELGIRGLYSGSSVTLARDVPSTALFFACYAALKQVMPDQTFVDGCLAAVPAAYLVTPMDVVKTRMQMEPEEGKEAYPNAWVCVKEIVEEEGLGALFKGGIARVLRMSPQFGITLMLYDMLSQ
ncbi:unnamed protein product [Closterium sp. Yama58-4]|nr:unnamed protein product [Closterium sp. Yama58-4]